MARLTRAQSSNEEDDSLRLYSTVGNTTSRHENSRNSNTFIQSTSNRSASFESSFQTSLRPTPRSHRTLRSSQSLSLDPIAYPLPDPSQYEDAKESFRLPDLNDDILHPLQSLIRASQQEKESIRGEYEYLNSKQSLSPAEEFAEFHATGEQHSPSVSVDIEKRKIPHQTQSSMRATQQEGECISESLPEGDGYRSSELSLLPIEECLGFYAIDEQHSPLVSENIQKEKIQKSFAGNFSENDLVGPQTGAVEVKKEEEVKTRARMEEIMLESVPSKVVVVSDGEKKFTIAPVDLAINEYATTEGDTIIVLAYLQHVMSPMGMKMVADVKMFSGVNETCIKQAVSEKKDEIEYKLQRSGCSQACQKKKIQLQVKVLSGANPKFLIVHEIQALQGTCAIFDKNAMKDKKYYAGNLTCHILRLRSDGRQVETVSLFGQGIQKSGSITSQYSDTSSESMSSENTNSLSLWARIKSLASKRYSAPHRPSHGRAGSTANSSRTSSTLGSPSVAVEEQDATNLEQIEKSFSFDSPQPNQVPVYVYAAAGLDIYVPEARNRRSYTTALAV